MFRALMWPQMHAVDHGQVRIVGCKRLRNLLSGASFGACCGEACPSESVLYSSMRSSRASRRHRDNFAKNRMRSVFFGARTPPPPRPGHHEPQGCKVSLYQAELDAPKIKECRFFFLLVSGVQCAGPRL